MTRITLTVAAALAAVVAIVIGGTAFAQYPPPQGSLVCEGAVIIPQTGSSVPVRAILDDSSGSPVEGQLVQFAIGFQPGTTAFLSSPNAFTDANGIASVTLFTGFSPGQIVVLCNGLASVTEVRGLSGQLVTEVRVESIFRPPSTGDAGLAAQSGYSRRGLIAAAAVAGTLAVAVTASVRWKARVRA